MKRIFHTWDKWECYKAGFYAERPEGFTVEEGEEQYRKFLGDIPAFERALDRVTTEWVHSCEHYLSNVNMNRIAWLGQAAMAYARGIPSCCRGGYHRLTSEQQRAADASALKFLNRWLVAHGDQELTLDQAASKTEMDLY